MVVIPMLSPALGGELMARFGWQFVFLIVAGFSVVLFAVMLYLLPETLKESVPLKDCDAVDIRTAATVRWFRSYALCVAFVSVVFSFVAARRIMVSAFNRPPRLWLLFYHDPAGVYGRKLTTRMLTQRFSINQLISLGGSIALLGIIAALAFQMLGNSHPLALFVPVAIAVFGNGITPQCSGGNQDFLNTPVARRPDRLSANGTFGCCCPGRGLDLQWNRISPTIHDALRVGTVLGIVPFRH